MNYSVRLKSGVSILVEGVTSIWREGADGFIEFYNDKEIVGSFSVDDVSYFVKIDNPEDFKTICIDVNSEFDGC
ncbi:hypothetical protein [Metasolibacillus meyeri]|uniref:hypothetical protein n=1 Tax=Metasolibacillus meyeri TaxID=1071052 RepID=UPI000D2FDF67|nr:hypothetical protein [Metasolibacillus meyeri]